jgi:hypothetical protein
MYKDRPLVLACSKLHNEAVRSLHDAETQLQASRLQLSYLDTLMAGRFWKSIQSRKRVEGGREGSPRTGKGQTGESAGTNSPRRTASKSMREVAALLLPPPAFAFPPPRDSSAAATAADLPVARGSAASGACVGDTHHCSEGRQEKKPHGVSNGSLLCISTA